MSNPFETILKQGETFTYIDRMFVVMYFEDGTKDPDLPPSFNTLDSVTCEYMNDNGELTIKIFNDWQFESLKTYLETRANVNRNAI